ncbi:MAG: TlpA family protein disulfide reductase [Acidobacteriota bacterium]|nr:MAG: TlpA family protein disulfide reductase [Acidobacteriota bacterium]
MHQLLNVIWRRAAAVSLFALIFVPLVSAQSGSGGSDSGQTVGGKAVNLNVKQIDEESIKPLLVPDGKPLLINFWATWCEPCREEFPELIEIDRDYVGKIDFLIISLDDPVEITRDVPKFLEEMGSTMTPYLLRTLDETAVIGSISKDWQGGLPFTVLYDAEGKVAHARQGKIKLPVVRGILDGLLAKPGPVAVTELVKIVNGKRDEAVFYYRNNWMKLREEAVKRGYIESYEMQVGDPREEGEFDIVLITRYRDKAQFDASEPNFQKLIKELLPIGPVRMNEAVPDEFRKSVGVRTTESVGPHR